MVSVLGKAAVMSLHGVPAGVTLAKDRNQRKDEASLRAGSLLQGIKGAAEITVNTTKEEKHMLNFQTYLNTPSLRVYDNPNV